jgi:hypothetical protein
MSSMHQLLHSSSPPTTKNQNFLHFSQRKNTERGDCDCLPMGRKKTCGAVSEMTTLWCVLLYNLLIPRSCLFRPKPYIHILPFIPRESDTRHIYIVLLFICLSLNVVKLFLHEGTPRRRIYGYVVFK